MPYTLENPIDSLKVVAESEAGWLGRFEDNGSEIMFFVDPNEEASSRSAEVTAVYGDIVQTFTVNQDGAVGPFQFNVKEIGYDHITYDVIPEDKEMTYISYVIHSDYAGWDPDDTDAYIQDELNWYISISLPSPLRRQITSLLWRCSMWRTLRPASVFILPMTILMFTERHLPSLTRI